VSFDDITTASVIMYPYLWDREHRAGEIEGRKPRETAVALRVARKDDKQALILLAITTTPPTADQDAVEVPEIEKRRTGLDMGKPVWIILDEYNYDVIGESFYLEPEPPIGQFSDAFFKPVVAAFTAKFRERARVRRGA